MKKFFAIMALFSLLLSLAACGGNNSTPSSTQTSSQPESSQADSSGSDPSSAPVSSSETETNTSTPEEIPAGSSAENTPAPEAAATSSNILVAYFSRVGNMDYDPNVDAVASASINLSGSDIAGNAQLLAEMAQEVTGGDLFFIETVEKYPSAYRATTDKARTEQSEDARPELASHLESIDAYDTIVLIYPNWWGTLPQPVMTFLEEYDFTGKTIYPLCTHEGSAMGRSEGDIARLVPGAQVEDGLAVRGSSAASAKESVESWLSQVTITPDAAAAARITMTVGETVITAELDQSETAQAFLATLPRTLSMTRYDDREYYGRIDPLPENGETIPDFTNGDVTYYPAGPSFAVFFDGEERSSQGGLIRMGKITSDLSDFARLGESAEIRIEIAG